MNLTYNTNDVTAVLLTDGWHDVDDNTFKVGPYEYVSSGGVDYDSFAGFEFRQAGVLHAGPIDAIRAVKIDRPAP